MNKDQQKTVGSGNRLFFTAAGKQTRRVEVVFEGDGGFPILWFFVCELLVEKVRGPAETNDQHL